MRAYTYTFATILDSLNHCSGSPGYNLGSAGRVRHVIEITLRNDFALSHNAYIFSRIVFASNSCRSEHIEPIIAFYSYCSDVIEKLYGIYSLLLLGKWL